MGNSEVLQQAERVAATSPKDRWDELDNLEFRAFPGGAVERVNAAAASGKQPTPLTSDELIDLANLHALSTKAGKEYVQSRDPTLTVDGATVVVAKLKAALLSGITSPKSTLKQSSIASENLKAFNTATGQNTPVPWTRGKKLATGLGVTAGVGVVGGGGVAGYMESKNT